MARHHSMSAWKRQGHSLSATGRQLGGTSEAKRNKILCLFAPQVSRRRRPAVPKVSRRSRRHVSGGLAEGHPTRWSVPYCCAPHPQTRRSRGKSMRLTWILCNSRAKSANKSRNAAPIEEANGWRILAGFASLREAYFVLIASSFCWN